jgi:hypothetical protein
VNLAVEMPVTRELQYLVNQYRMSATPMTLLMAELIQQQFGASSLRVVLQNKTSGMIFEDKFAVDFGTLRDFEARGFISKVDLKQFQEWIGFKGQLQELADAVAEIKSRNAAASPKQQQESFPLEAPVRRIEL